MLRAFVKAGGELNAEYTLKNAIEKGKYPRFYLNIRCRLNENLREEGISI